MSRTPLSFGKIDVGLSTTLSQVHAKPSEETPFRMLFLGDFSGRASRGVCEPKQHGGRKPTLVDRDNFDAVLAKVGVEVHLRLADDAPPVVLRFQELDDFHPDRIVKQVGLFDALRDTRRRLNNPATYEAAAEQVRTWSKKASTPVAAAPTESPVEQDPAKLLEQMLGEAPAGEPLETMARGGDVNWDAYLARIVQPHVLPRTDPQQADLIALVDDATSAQMRVLLQHPALQAVEAAWRALFFLVRRLDTDEGLKLYLLDVSKGELAADLTGDDLSTSGAFKLLVEQTVGTPGAVPWAAVVGAYTFDQHRGDVELLGRLARLAQLAGAPFLAAAGCKLLGCRNLAGTPEPDHWRVPTDLDDWEELRRQPEAAYLGLAMPRILLRLPFGKDTSPVEAFAFEEMPDKPVHEAFLWGNPAFFVAYLLGAAYNRAGWQLRPGMVQEIDSLSLYVPKGEDDEAQPCAEGLLTDRAAVVILNRGVMPFRSVRNRDAVLLAQFQSLAEPAKPLAGRWR